MLVPPHVAPEEALEWFFDHYIADNPKTVKEEEEEKEEEEKEEEEKEEEKKEEEKKEEEKKEEEEKEEEEATKKLLQPEKITQASLNCFLDLRWIAMNGRNVKYSEELEQVQFRFRSPKVAAAVTAEGRIICTGASSVEDAHTVARRVARIIQKMGFPVSFSGFRVHNFLLVFHTFPICLERLYVELLGNCSYEPELFRGLFFYSEKVTACVFHTGTVFLTGSTDRSECIAVLRRIYPALSTARTQDTPPFNNK